MQSTYPKVWTNGIFLYTCAGLAQLGLAWHISPAQQGIAFPLQQGCPLVGVHLTNDAPRWLVGYNCGNVHMEDRHRQTEKGKRKKKIFFYSLALLFNLEWSLTCLSIIFLFLQSLSTAKKACMFKAPSDWNNLPVNIQSISSFHLLKNAVSYYRINCTCS